MSNYSKHKDRKPEDTIFEIQRILNKAGLFTTTQWVEEPYKGVRSNRVVLYPTTLGSNGKGTDEVYATASGYAELIERIQNGLLTLRLPSPEVRKAGGFRFSPDEKEMSVDEIIEQKDPYLESLFLRLGIFTHDSKKQFLLDWEGHYDGQKEGSVIALPFTVPDQDRIVWLPRDIVFDFCGSNGLAAGNTLEEALVQGISELFERYVNWKMIRGECVPPRIPDEELKPYSFWPLIEQIRKEGKYDVFGLDCSLGRGIPVSGICIVNKDKGTFSCKLGGHPSFAVAMERTLTEAFQGRSVESTSQICVAGTQQEALHFHNLTNVSKIGLGVYPAAMFTSKPDWEYKPWKEWEGLDNRTFLVKLLEKIREEGFTAMIRNSSHLGFPACQVLAPGMGEIYPVIPLQVRSRMTGMAAFKSFLYFPDFSEEEEKRILRLIRFKEDSILENEAAFMFGRPLQGSRFTLDRIGAFLAIKAGDYKTGIHFLMKLLSQTQDPKETVYLNALVKYVHMKADGMDDESIYRLLRTLYRKEAADRVEHETNDKATMMQKLFPKAKCFDCEHCELAGVECGEPQETELFLKIKKAMAGSTVSQEETLEFLKKLIDGCVS